ncbi:MAG: YceI family protein [Pseudomonadota bacterium]
MTRVLILIALIAALALPAWAEPARYRLDPDASRVEFTYVLNGAPAKGTMPISSADLVLDFADVSRSTAAVALNANRARTGVIFVTEALKSPEVLDTRSHPQIRFVSRSVSGGVNGARVAGDATVRGVTRPLTLQGRIYRREGSQAGDLSRLTVLLEGQLDRRDFGASGFAALVEPTVGLRIVARLVRVEG